ncbi:MAG: type II toxin-antitoxin system RelE/ParE family toxin [Dehalococcoidia bacterium]|nr:type II toxin-antitoxin system RelE/ParE family toxin [Dehalococcoidia bacterium]
MSWNILYYEDETEHESVVEEIENFSEKARAKILRFIDLMEEKGPTKLRGEYTAHIQDDTWELRIDSGSDRFRVLYFAVKGRTVIMLRAFLKKTKKTPPREITTAKRRHDDWLART